MTICYYCGSNNVKQHGKRYNKYRVLNVFKCYDCYRTFTDDTIYKGCRHHPHIINAVVSLSRLGVSSRNVSKIMKLIGFSIHNNTIISYKNKFLRTETRNIEERLFELKEKLYPFNKQELQIVQIRTICGYSKETPIDHTVLFKRGILKRVRKNRYLIDLPKKKKSDLI